MDFRSSRPERRVAPQSGSADASPPEEPQPKKETPRIVQHIGTTHHVAKEDKPKRFIIPIVIAAVVMVAVIGGLIVWLNGKSSVSGIDSKKYQAVFFTNGQVYFGKLSSLNDNYMKLTDIFYLQTHNQTETEEKENPQETTTDQNSNVQLIKLGNEVHGPEDAMIISRDQVLFYENLKADGKVATTIADYKNKQ